MREWLTAVAALAAGAAVMYYLDPDRGRRRRALVRDQVLSISHETGGMARARGKRAADRMKGLVARGRARLRPAEPESDAQLRDRIRSRLGRIVSHPRAVHVDVDRGRVSLSGHILAEDVDALMSSVHGMAGVHDVHNRLSVHDEPGHVPELQGSARARASEGATASTLSIVALAAAPMAILIGAAGRAARHRGNGLHVVH